MSLVTGVLADLPTATGQQLQSRFWPTSERRALPITEATLPTEKLDGQGVWVDPALSKGQRTGRPVTVWFENQFLGDGKAFMRRSKEFAGHKRRKVSKQVVATLMTLAEQSYQAAEQDMRGLVAQKQIGLVQWHWIVNGFSCVATDEGIASLKNIPGVKKIFQGQPLQLRPANDNRKPKVFAATDRSAFDPDQYQHPWYCRSLMADKVWRELEVSGQGTLNVVMDFQFLFSASVTANLYRNPNEIPGNQKDDDGNGLIDDYHGFNFGRGDAVLNTKATTEAVSSRDLHGFMCAAEICGTGSKLSPYEFGLAPSATWAGVIGSGSPEAPIQWAIEQQADTLSMSFSIPNLGEFRSHWRKIMEHATFCGLHCVSGAGNFGQSGSPSFAPVPTQMRIPEDIPLAVFAPAGVQRNLARTPFSSQGPVRWDTEHYHDGFVPKPDLAAFNMSLPLLAPDGSVRPTAINGNSFAGPMTAGSLALMLSADPDLLPWDARQILTETATDIANKGVDYQTGHGLINCFRAVREVLRRKNLRDGSDPQPYEGRQPGDELDLAALKRLLKPQVNIQMRSVPGGSLAEQAGLKPGDVIRAIDGTTVLQPTDIGKATKLARSKNAKSMTFTIERMGKAMNLSVPVPKQTPLGLRVLKSESYNEPVFE